MSEPTPSCRYSTVADFELVAGGQSYDVVQVAPDFIILQTPQQIPPGDAELIIRVDGKVLRRHIALPNGATTGMKRVPIKRY